MLTVLGIAASVLASVALITRSLSKAPEAWEDDSGFHFADPAFRRAHMSGRIAPAGESCFEHGTRAIASVAVR